MKFRLSRALGIPLATALSILAIANYRTSPTEISQTPTTISQPARVADLEARVTSAETASRERPDSVSQDAVDFIKGFEKFEGSVYNDQGGEPTICYGHLIKPDENFTTMSEGDCEALLRQDLNRFENAVRESVTADISENQYDALVSLAFNIGPTAFRNSSLVRKLNAEDYEGAAEQFDVWRLVNGKVSNGLVKRRAKEREIFEDGVYDSSH